MKASLALLALPLLLGAAPDEVVTIRNKAGMTVRLLPFGATVMAVEVPDAKGRRANVVLGYASPAEYRTSIRKNFFGATVGRYAGRIGGASFTLGGRTVQLAANDGSNALHGGGEQGLESVTWRARRLGPDAVAFTTTSPDGYQGFPGALSLSVTYRVGPDNSLRIDYAARTTKPTALNLTNHSYFNLAGEGSGTATSHTLQLAAQRYVATDEGGIPTGKLPQVASTPFDFRCPRAISERIAEAGPRGYNHAWAFDRWAGRLAPVARLSDPASGRTLTIETTEPSVQVYTGGYMDGQDRGASGKVIRPGDGVALEMQHLSDSVHHPEFPTTYLLPGQTYRSTTIWRFGTGSRAVQGCPALR